MPASRKGSRMNGHKIVVRNLFIECFDDGLKWKLAFGWIGNDLSYVRSAFRKFQLI